MKIIELQGLVIDKKNYGEADVWLTVLSENYGKINFVVKGIRKSKKREQSAVDILALSKFILVKKEENYSLSKFELVDSYEEIKKDIDKISIALYIMFILNNFMIEKTLYNLALKTLDFMKVEDELAKNIFVLNYFLIKLAKYEGILEESFLKEMSEKLNKFKSEEASAEKFVEVVYDIERYINKNTEIKLNFKNYRLG